MKFIHSTEYQEWSARLQLHLDDLERYKTMDDWEKYISSAEATLKEYRVKARYNKPPKRKDLIDYLRSHIEWEHIELDLRERYGHSSLNKLSHNQLYNIAENYGYLEGDE